jgi:NAD(P)-dependent dehydrogenase (short-subunit alcohol dehydrogenase family)
MMTPVPAWSAPRTAIVTGGGSGIGVAISMRLAREGASVAILDRDGEAAEATADAIATEGGTAIGVSVDVSDRAAIEAGVAAVRDRLGAATILINNAGITPFSRFLAISQEEYEQVFAINVRGVFDLCQVVIPDMISAGWGRIVNISSSSAQTGNAGQVHYSASKGAVVAMTRSLAKEFGLLASRGSDYHGPNESPYRPGTLPPLPAGLTPVWSLLNAV